MNKKVRILLVMVLCLKEAMSGKYLISSEWKKCETKENIQLRESAQEKD